MRASFLNSINDISSEQWNSVTAMGGGTTEGTTGDTIGNSYPFIRHEFLAAMENSGSANAETGWQPQHLVIYDGERVIAVMPLYLKYHSYGEYIFDWAWANAYERYGLAYYPKLLSAIPFTPATGPRLSHLDSVDTQQLYPYVKTVLQDRAVTHQASSIHILLPDSNETQKWNQQGISTRATSQFHWYNNNYKNFGDFLNTFSSRKRKNLKKERRRITEQGITLNTYTGDNISSAMWDTFFHFYQLTYAKRSGHGGYLKRQFFDLIHTSMPEQVMLVLADVEGQYVAGALYFFSDTTLYGRYWGCTQEFEMLHFEACYYQGIEFCIKQGLQKFDAGAQGEHKIQRGFSPTTIWSNHWIKDQQFADAIYGFIEKEAEHNTAYIEDAKTYLPFKKGE